MQKLPQIGKKQKQVLERIRRRSVQITKQNLSATKDKGLRIAVTKAGYDDIGSILKQLHYSYTVIDDPEVSDYGRLKNYRVLFINCSLSMSMGAERNKDSLRRYVEGGGILYASDLAAAQISAAFPYTIKFSDSSGFTGWINAKVGNEDLRRIIGPTIQIYFDLANVYPIDSIDEERVKVYLSGFFKTPDGCMENNRPILVSFRCRAGEVIYTTFHNHAQASKKEEQLLKFMVLKPISVISKVPILQLAQRKGLLLTGGDS